MELERSWSSTEEYLMWSAGGSQPGEAFDYLDDPDSVIILPAPAPATPAADLADDDCPF